MNGDQLRVYVDSGDPPEQVAEDPESDNEEHECRIPLTKVRFRGHCIIHVDNHQQHICHLPVVYTEFPPFNSSHSVITRWWSLCPYQGSHRNLHASCHLVFIFTLSILHNRMPQPPLLITLSRKSPCCNNTSMFSLNFTQLQP